MINLAEAAKAYIGVEDGIKQQERDVRITSTNYFSPFHFGKQAKRKEWVVVVVVVIQTLHRIPRR